MREFVQGVGLLGRGFAYWRRAPGTMALGLIPAAIVAPLLLSGVTALALSLPRITVAITPWADAWPGLWATILRITIGTAAVGAALALVAVSFTALTLIVGEPFYEKIWRSVERDLGDDRVDSGSGFWRSLRDGIGLLMRGIAVALLATLAGLIPGVGGVIGPVTAVLLTGWLLADELSSRALSARGLDRLQRRDLLRGHRLRVLGFGVGTQLCFLVPLGAIATMPAAVAGSTLLARSLLERPQHASV